MNWSQDVLFSSYHAPEKIRHPVGTLHGQETELKVAEMAMAS